MNLFKEKEEEKEGKKERKGGRLLKDITRFLRRRGREEKKGS